MDFKVARQSMVDCQLATNNVISEKVLEAMGSIPRELFLPEQKREVAYLDEDILIGEGRYLLEPMITGRMIQALEPQSSDIALDVGCGSGYSAAVLSSMVETVIALETNENLRQHATKTWLMLDMCNIADMDVDKITDSSTNGPYDIIFVNGAVQEIPEVLINQLKEDTGRMVCVQRDTAQINGTAVLVKKMSGGGMSVQPLFDANIPYLEEFGPTKEHFSF